jgi:hypothetical protein
MRRWITLLGILLCIAVADSIIQRRKSARLQAEISQLHGLTNESAMLRFELDRLRIENDRLRRDAAIRPDRADSEPISTEYVPKEKWVHSGYATPADTLQTWLWSFSRGDLDTYIASATTTAGEQLKADIQESGREQYASRMLKISASFKGFRLAKQDVLNDNQILLTVSIDSAEGEQIQQLLFIRTDGEWRLGPKPGRGLRGPRRQKPQPQ